MSMNISIYIKIGSTLTRVNSLIQTTTEDSNTIMHSSSDWKTRAIAYLTFVRCSYPDYIYKHQRKIVGDAWRTAEENGGCLEFRIE